MKPIRILLVADTHLGFDMPFKPRVEKPRRGEDFFHCFRAALASALHGEVDLVVHGGDMFYRSKIPEQLVWLGFQPLFEVADAGVPVYLVPGNHERGHIPHGLLALHEQVHIFHQPGNFIFEKKGVRVQLVGFPSERDNPRSRFGDLLAHTRWWEQKADFRLLCAHQAFEGAQVEGFTFRHREDTIPLAAIPHEFDAVLAGHIHRSQVLTHDLAGRPSPAPVLYPGSVERTSFVERFEEKVAMIVEVTPGRVGWRTFPLPARPMVVIDWRDTGEDDLRAHLQSLPENAVAQLRIHGDWPRWLTAAWLRENAGERVVETRRARK